MQRSSLADGGRPLSIIETTFQLSDITASLGNVWLRLTLGWRQDEGMLSLGINTLVCALGAPSDPVHLSQPKKGGAVSSRGTWRQTRV
jgi:hypothetical protein